MPRQKSPKKHKSQGQAVALEFRLRPSHLKPLTDVTHNGDKKSIVHEKPERHEQSETPWFPRSYAHRYRQLYDRP
jgi:hypothetical protein